MKLGLPLKLGIFVVLLFAAVIATCLLWTPVKLAYYTGMLESSDSKKRVAGVDGLLRMGPKGLRILSGYLKGTIKAAEFLSENWKYYNTPVPGDGNERFPLHIAAENNFYNAAQFFIDKGADVNAKDDVGRTPIHWAARRGNKEVAAVLLVRNADANSKGNDGSTPLSHAVKRDHKKVAALLLKAGADVNERTRSGATQLDKANSEEMKNLLRAQGGKTGAELRKEAGEKEKE